MTWQSELPNCARFTTEASPWIRIPALAFGPRRSTSGFHPAKCAPYYGDESFLVGPTKRTEAIWKKLQKLFVEERKKGVLETFRKSPVRSRRIDAGLYR
jgi:formate C-acetyltransferase